MDNPYKTIGHVVEQWCLYNYYDNMIVSMLVNDSIKTEILIYEDGELIWLNDWWEGEREVALLGFRPVSMMKIDTFPENYTD